MNESINNDVLKEEEQNIALSCSDICKSYVAGKVILSDVSLSLKKGQVKALVGENGSGKTTLIKILSGYQQWDSGSITFDNQTFDDGTEFSNVDYIRKNVSTVISGEVGLENSLTLYEFLQYWFLLNNEPFGEKHYASLVVMMKDLNMNPAIFFNSSIGTYSRGMKQKVHIVKSFLSDKKVIFMDEPFIGLDVMTNEALIRFTIKDREKNNRSFIIISHDLNHLSELCDEIMFINKGKLGTVMQPNKLLRDGVSVEITYSFNNSKHESDIEILIKERINFVLQKNIELSDDITHISYKRIGERMFSIYLIISPDILSSFLDILEENMLSIGSGCFRSGIRNGMTYDLLSEMTKNCM